MPFEGLPATQLLCTGPNLVTTSRISICPGTNVNLELMDKNAAKDFMARKKQLASSCPANKRFLECTFDVHLYGGNIYLVMDRVSTDHCWGESNAHILSLI